MTTFISVCVLSLVAVICVLSWLAGEMVRSEQFHANIHHTEREAHRLAYQALAQSYLIDTGKTYVPPAVSRVDNTQRPHSPDPTKRAFRFKAPPPMTENSPPPSLGQRK